LISGSIFGSDSVDSGCRYGLTIVDRKDVGPLGSLIVHVSPLTVSRLYGPSQCPAWPIFPSLHTKTGEFGSRSWTVSVFGLFRMLNALATCRSTRSLRISAMAFFTAFAHCVTVGEGASSSVIRRYAPNTSKVGTRPSGPAVLLRALNAICRAASLSILGSSTTMIW
jgi:hypothetical protein